MIAPILIACCCAATTCLALGIVVYRKRITAARGLDKLFSFSPVLMAVCRCQRSRWNTFFATSALASIVPYWLPFHLFSYLSGRCRITCGSFKFFNQPLCTMVSAVAHSLVYQFRASDSCAEHYPSLARETVLDAHRSRIALRRRCVGLSCKPFASEGFCVTMRKPYRDWQLMMAAAVLLFFAVQHFLFPVFAPGVPLPKRTPPWVPLVPLWAYGAGLIYLASAYMFLVSSRTRMAAALSGSTLLFLTCFPVHPASCNQLQNSAGRRGFQLCGGYTSCRFGPSHVRLGCWSARRGPRDRPTSAKRHQRVIADTTKLEQRVQEVVTKR